MWHAQWSEQLRRADAAARAAPYISSLSVIVPVFNMQDTIGSALASIEASVASLGGMLARSEVHRAHGVPVTCEVIVLDDASTDSTQQEVAEFISPALMPDLPASVRLEYTLLVATANSGQAAGRNAAARRAKGDVLLFLDADDVFRPEHLGLGYKSLSANATVAWARTGLVVPDSVLPEWKEVQTKRCPFPQLYGQHWRLTHDRFMYRLWRTVRRRISSSEGRSLSSRKASPQRACSGATTRTS